MIITLIILFLKKMEKLCNGNLWHMVSHIYQVVFGFGNIVIIRTQFLLIDL